MPDQHADAADILLTSGHLGQCNRYYWGERTRCHLCRPRKHRDREPGAYAHWSPSPDEWVRLYKQSDVLPFMDITGACPGSATEWRALIRDELMLSDSPRLAPVETRGWAAPYQPFPTEDEPELEAIHILSPTRLVEAYTKLFAYEKNIKLTLYWSHKLSVLAECIQPRGLIEVDRLPADCKEAYQLLIANDVKGSYAKIRTMGGHEPKEYPAREKKEDDGSSSPRYPSRAYQSEGDTDSSFQTDDENEEDEESENDENQNDENENDENEKDENEKDKNEKNKNEKDESDNENDDDEEEKREYLPYH